MTELNVVRTEFENSVLARQELGLPETNVDACLVISGPGIQNIVINPGESREELVSQLEDQLPVFYGEDCGAYVKFSAALGTEWNSNVRILYPSKEVVRQAAIDAYDSAVKAGVVKEPVISDPA